MRRQPLSRAILTDLPREEMGFDGVILTDALNMKAITSRYSVEEVVRQGVDAGVDLFLMPADPVRAFEAPGSAVRAGGIPMQRIDESVLRILTLKYAHGLFEAGALPDADLLGAGASILDGLV